MLLLDEPMAALDPKLRKEMQVEVKNLRERLGTTFAFVTHDQEEALVMADRIAVMSHGRIEQLERTEALYERSRTRTLDHPGLSPPEQEKSPPAREIPADWAERDLGETQP